MERGCQERETMKKTVVARTMTGSELASERKETVRYKRNNEREP